MRGFVAFVVLLIGLDQALGLTLDTLYRRTSSGETGGQINLALERNPDILVLGSSRARAHVSPSILHARLSASVFNAGADGQDFLYAIMLFDLWSRRHHPPAAIILNVDPWSLAKEEEEIERTSVFSAYFAESETVRRILLMRDRYAGLKYLSYSYRFNGKVLPIIKNLFLRPDPGFDGYIGVQGASIATGTDRQVDEPDWDVKLQYLKELMEYCTKNRTRLFLITAPVFRSNPARNVWSARMSRLVTSYPGLDFLDLSERAYPQLFAGQARLYHDNLHLNARGAELFSTLLASQIAERISKPPAAAVARTW